MALMLSKTCDALVAAGTPPDKARAAAEEVANLHNRLTRIEIMLTGTLALVVFIAGAALKLLIG